MAMDTDQSIIQAKVRKVSVETMDEIKGLRKSLTCSFTSGVEVAFTFYSFRETKRTFRCPFLKGKVFELVSTQFVRFWIFVHFLGKKNKMLTKF